ncbi:CoA transferase [Micromonospora sp. NPDC049679]|uniref:CaiB/BaiF CoA transferase family protein n=1 Tax=Micromonospora sp. NPDC049679 TaxID=3155920 RepID=UPI00340D63E0
MIRRADTPPSGHADRAGPLAGVLVADFSRVLAGPLATMTLADLGADVVKVERPVSGDETRGWAPPVAADGTATYYLSVNRNKRSIALDLSTPDGRQLARELAVRADVLVENFAPGTMERFGLGYDALAVDNPALVYASVTGFGRDAGAALPGYDFLVQAVGGLMSITGEPDGEPTKVGVALVDVLAGLHLATGVTAALLARARTGRGQRVEVSLLGALMASLVNQASGQLNADAEPSRMGNAHPSIAPYQTLRTADRPIAVAVGNDRQFSRMAAVVGLDTDPRFATNQSRVRHREVLVAALEKLLSARPSAHWQAALQSAGVPCGPVNTVAEGLALAERLGLAPIVRQERDGVDVRTIANPVGLSDTPVSYRRPPPGLGEQTAEITEWLAGERRRP